MSEHPKPFGTTSERDWEEDFFHENGNYRNLCMDCKQEFYGHKRRIICKKCATPNWAELAKKQPPQDTKDNKAWHGAWLEGEMVGYAKCMVERVQELEQKNKELDGNLLVAEVRERLLREEIEMLKSRNL